MTIHTCSTGKKGPIFLQHVPWIRAWKNDWPWSIPFPCWNGYFFQYIAQANGTMIFRLISIMGSQVVQTYFQNGLKSSHIRLFTTDLEREPADRYLDIPPILAFLSGSYFQRHWTWLWTQTVTVTVGTDTKSRSRQCEEDFSTLGSHFPQALESVQKFLDCFIDALSVFSSLLSKLSWLLIVVTIKIRKPIHL